MVRGQGVRISANQEHASVQPVWTRLADQFCCHHVLILRPAVLHSELAHSLRSSKSGLKPCLSAIKVVLGLVEHFVCLEDNQDSFLSCKNIFREEEL